MDDMNREKLLRSIIAGLVAVIFGVTATLIVDLVIPTPNVAWSLIAVSFAAFFAGFAGYFFGMQQRRQNP